MNEHTHSPIEIDPRPCEECGLQIDRHVMVDHGEGPEFYCPPADELTLPELERRAELIRGIEIAAMVREMELADPRDRWRHTGEPKPIERPEPPPRRAPYQTPQATVDAFWHVTRLGDPDFLTRWLAEHPADAPELFKLWKSKPC